MQDKNRFKFMVRFASERLDNYRAGDWSNLREDLNSFLDPPEHSIIDDRGAVARKPGKISDEDILSAQAHLQKFLRGVAEPRPERWVGSDGVSHRVLGPAHYH